jgi:hypothetical protein
MKLASISTIRRRASITTLAASALAMTVFAGNSVAQQKMAKDQLVGTWTIVSCANANGGKPAACVEPHGGMIFDAGGRSAAVWAGKRPNLPGNVTRGQRSAEDYKAAGLGLVTLFGTWSFDEAGQRFTIHTETSLFPNGEGNDLTFSVSRSGDELRLVQVAGNPGMGNTYRFRPVP